MKRRIGSILISILSVWWDGALAEPVDYAARQAGHYADMGQATASAQTPEEVKQIIQRRLTKPLQKLDRQRMADIKRTQAAADVTPRYFAGSPPAARNFRPGGDVDAQLSVAEYYRYRDQLSEQGYKVTDNGNSFTVRNHNATYHLEPNKYESNFEAARRQALNVDPEAAESVVYSQIKATVKDPKTGQLVTGQAYLDTPALAVGDYVKKNREAMDMLDKPGFERRMEAINFTNKAVVKTVNDLKAHAIDMGLDVSRLSQTEIVELMGTRRGAELDDFIRGMIKENQAVLDRAMTLSAEQATRQMNGLLHQAERAAAAGNMAEAALLRTRYQNTRAALIEAANASENQYILEQVFGPGGKPPQVSGSATSRLSQVLTWAGRALAVLSGLEGAEREVAAAEIAHRDPSVLYAIGRGLANFIGADRAWEMGSAAGENSREAILAEIEAAQREGRDPDFTWVQLMAVLNGIDQFVGTKDVRDLVESTGQMVEAEWNFFANDTDQRAQQAHIGEALLTGLRGQLAELNGLRRQLADLRPEAEQAGAMSGASAELGRQAGAQVGPLAARMDEVVAELAGIPATLSGPSKNALASIRQLADQACMPGQNERGAGRAVGALSEQVAALRRGGTAAGDDGTTDGTPLVDGDALLGEARAVRDRLRAQLDALDEAGETLGRYSGLLERALPLQQQIVASARRLRPLYPRLVGDLVDIETAAEADLPGAIQTLDAGDQNSVREAADVLGRAIDNLSSAMGGVRNELASNQRAQADLLASAEAELERAQECMRALSAQGDGESCASDNDCPIGYLCLRGTCGRDPGFEEANGGRVAVDCATDRDCGEGQRCDAGVCVDTGRQRTGSGDVLNLFGQREQQRDQEVGQRNANRPPSDSNGGYDLGDVDVGAGLPQWTGPGHEQPGHTTVTQPPTTTAPTTSSNPPTTGGSGAGYYLLRGVGRYTSGHQTCTATFYAVSIVRSTAELQNDLRRLEQSMASLPTGTSGTPVKVISTGVVSGPSKTQPKLPVPKGYTIECR